MLLKQDNALNNAPGGACQIDSRQNKQIILNLPPDRSRSEIQPAPAMWVAAQTPAGPTATFNLKLLVIRFPSPGHHRQIHKRRKP